PEDLLAFEQALQKETARKFKGLGSVCLKPMEKAPHFRELLMNRSREFLDAKLDQSDPASVFFRYRTGDHSAEPLLGEAFSEAAPDLTTTRGGEKPDEINVLAVPPGEAGERLRMLATEVLRTVELTAATMPDDI